MPSNIQDGNAVDYGESKMNTLIGAAAGVNWISLKVVVKR